MNKNVSLGIPKHKICGGLTKLLFACAVFLLPTGMAHAQQAKVTLDRQQVPVKEILDDIERQTDYLFVYNNEQLDFFVSVQAHDESVQDVLNRIFAGTAIRYAFEGKHIVLRREDPSPDAAAAHKPLNRTVTGHVRTVAGDPIVGATVLVQGGTVGTTTDLDGAFSLTVPAGSNLEVSFLGYARQEIAVGERTTLDIRLKENSRLLLCSDGLSNMVSDEEIWKIAETSSDLKEMGMRLVSLANENGGKDNIAVVLVQPDTKEVEVC